jgi:peptidoglycan L-alanyl-D-glutamate endopeptidase CwlK
MYQFSKRSLRNLQGIKPPLVDVAHQALGLSPVDFGIISGVRTREQQARLVKAGASETMDSRHLTGHAVDLAAYIGRSLRWDFALYVQIAEAWRSASLALGIPISWGAAWRRELGDWPSAEAAMNDYIRERRRKKLKVFLDAGHFELPRSRYP